jgi:ABC-2 type transport system permease protein
MLHALRLIPYLVQMDVRAQMEYRGAFWIDRIAQFITYGSSLAVLWLLVNRFGSLAGWNWPDLAFLFSFHILSYSIGASVSFTQMRDLEEQVRLGTFDVVMTKPISAWVFIVFSRFNIGYAGHVILGVAVMAWALTAATIPWSIEWVVYFLAALVSASLVTGAIMTAIGATALIWTRSNHLYSLYFGFWELSRYPLNVFPAGIQVIMLTVVPLAFMSAIPSAVMLGHPVPILGEWAASIALLAGPVCTVLAVLLWRHAMGKYQGAGG